jgi:hypothetical protein
MSEPYTMIRKDSSREVNEAITGALLVVDDRVQWDSLPLSAKASEKLLQTVNTMAAYYETGGLPPKLFFFRFAQVQALALFARRSMLITLIKPGADIVEAEIAARKVVAVAHLKGALKSDNPVVAALMRPKPEVSIALQPTTMNPTWKDASQVLENMMSKVLSQAQAARLLGIAMQKRGISFTDPCTGVIFTQVPAELTIRIPSKPIRVSLDKEAADYASKLTA